MENEKDLSPEESTDEIDIPLANGDEPLDPDAEIAEVDFISLDSLLYENDESAFDSDADDRDRSFESFFAEYRELIAGNLIAARKMKESENPESDILTSEIDKKSSVPTLKKEFVNENQESKSGKPNPVGAQNDSDKNDTITLKPEEYEPLEAKEEIFCEIPEENDIDIDVWLGEISNDESDEEIEENAQISFFPEHKPKTSNPVEEEVKVKKYDPENPRTVDTVFDFLELFIYTLVAVMILTTFFFRHSVVEGDSMNSTLSDGDHLIIWDAFYTPEREDIVVFEDYSTSLKKAVVKRVIGLPGETVEIKKNADGEFLVYIDGNPIKQEYAYYGAHYSSPNTGVWTLGENEIFVMGDNRYNSTDSRDYGVGPINVDSILGKVVLRFLPLDKIEIFN